MPLLIVKRANARHFRGVGPGHAGNSVEVVRRLRDYIAAGALAREMVRPGRDGLLEVALGV